jgi:hypothetical protein
LSSYLDSSVLTSLYAPAAHSSFYTFDRAQAQLARAAGLATPVRLRRVR